MVHEGHPRYYVSELPRKAQGASIAVGFLVKEKRAEAVQVPAVDFSWHFDAFYKIRELTIAFDFQQQLVNWCHRCSNVHHTLSRLETAAG